MVSVFEAIQIIAMSFCFLCIFILAFKKHNEYTGIMLLAFVSGFIQNTGYLLELTSRNIYEVYFAIRTEYIGAAFIIIFITIFCFKYCKHPLPRKLVYLFVLESLFVLFGVWTWKDNHMFYTSAAFSHSGLFPHVILGHGWLFYVFALTTVIELMASFIIVLISFFKTKERHMKNNYFVVLFVIAIPFVAFCIASLGISKEYDATPVSVAVAISIFGLSITRNHLFDVAGAAYENVIMNFNDPFICVNNEFGFESANTAAFNLFPTLSKYKYGEIIEDDLIQNLYKKHNSSEIVVNEKIFELHINEVREGERIIGNSVLLIDITDSKKQIETMRDYIAEAENSNNAKMNFLADVSHEVRTPINVITGMSEVLVRDYPNKDTKECMDDIRNSAEVLTNLVNNIIDYTNIELKKLHISNSEFDMRQCLTELVNIYDYKCGEKELKFEYEIDENLNRIVVGDQVRFKQIINCLLSNALKYTETGSVKLIVENKVADNKDINVVVKVIDTGIGIKNEDKKRIFEDFTSFSMSHLEMLQSGSGTGLDLMMAKKLLTLMGGVIDFKSTYQKGSEFIVVIPLRISDSSEKVGKIYTKESEKEVFDDYPVIPNAKILVVDDAKVNLIVAKQLLKKTEAQIVTAESGEKCIELMKQEHFDLILLDHRMPGLDGVETLRLSREMETMCKDTPIIMLTANAIGEAQGYYLSVGFDDFLSKPVNGRMLMEIVKKYVEY